MKVYLGADHRGYFLKEKISRWLLEWGYEFEDVGAEHFDPEDDYTLYAQKVASRVRVEDGTRGILICGSGVGMDVAANKFDGVRASIGKSAEQVRAGRQDDDMNILVIAADYTSEEDARKMVKVFLEVEFDESERHKRRLLDIERIEANN